MLRHREVEMFGRAISLFSLFSSLAFSAGWEASEPVWLLPPAKAELKETACDLSGLFKEPLDISLNNLAIARDGKFLYAAFRTSRHHHPKYPLWAKNKIPGAYRTRLYVIKSEVSEATWEKLPEGLCELPWTLEGEAGEALSRYLSDVKGNAAAETKLFGGAIAKDDLPLIYDEYDLREPLFLNVAGKLRLYFVQIKGKAMEFVPMRTYALDLADKKIQPILEPGELMWEIQSHLGKHYATSYRGGHYSIKEADKTSVYFKTTEDGLNWKAVDENKKVVFEGGANEAAFAFAENGELYTVMRHEDGGPHGWGALVGKAKSDKIAEWSFPDRVDPKRYDSPRLFFQGDRLLLIARQNIGIRIPKYDPRVNDFSTNLFRLVMKRDDEGELIDPETNFPFDLNFTDDTGAADYTNGPLRREAMLKDIEEKKIPNKAIGNPLGIFFMYELHYNAKEPKRTALYEVSRETGEVTKVLTLPSAGDTAFPSLIRVSESEMLVGNYSSPFDKVKRSWGTGQENPTGIYLIKLRYR